MKIFKDKDSIIRCVVAAVATGVDLRDVDIVVHIGCPKSTITYSEETGRCARDGRKGISVILYDNYEKPEVAISLSYFIRSWWNLAGV